KNNSPVVKLNICTKVLIGAKLPCALFIAPSDEAVLTAEKRADESVPNRTSLPSTFDLSIPVLVLAGAAFRSLHPMKQLPAARKIAINPNRVHPWRRSPTIWPNAQVIAAGMASINNIEKKFVMGVGFSNGWAEFELKKPPPSPALRSLIASCEATGPAA